MAVEIIVTKKSVQKIDDNQFQIIINLTCKDGEQEVINQNITQNHNASNSVDVAKNEILSKAQTIINQYKETQIIFNSQQIDNAICAIQESLMF